MVFLFCFFVLQMHVHGVHMCICIDWCTFACVSAHVWCCTWMSVSVHVDTVGWCPESSSVDLYLIHCYRVSQLNLKDIDLAGWRSQFVLGILSPFSDCSNDKWATSTWHFSMFEDLNSRLHAVQQIFYSLSYLPRTANSFKATKCCLKLLCSRSVLLIWFFSFVLVHYHVISWELIFFTWINILILVSFLLINCCSTWTSELLKQAW